MKTPKKTRKKILNCLPINVYKDERNFFELSRYGCQKRCSKMDFVLQYVNLLPLIILKDSSIPLQPKYPQKSLRCTFPKNMSFTPPPNGLKISARILITLISTRCVAPYFLSFMLVFRVKPGI